MLVCCAPRLVIVIAALNCQLATEMLHQWLLSAFVYGSLFCSCALRQAGSMQ